MSKKVLTRTIDITKLTDGQCITAKGMFNEAIGGIEKWIGKAIDKNEKLKREEKRRAEQKAEKDRIARRKELDEEGKAKRCRQRDRVKHTGKSLQQIEKEEQIAQALKNEEKKEQEISDRLKREHPESCEINKESESSSAEPTID